MDKKFPQLKRTVVGLDVIWPALSLSFGWSRVNTNSNQDDEYLSRTGILLKGSLEAKPFIGLSAYIDFLGLLQRAHPIALAVVAVADLTMELIGDGSKITCELRATGMLGGRLQGFLNTMTGENSFNKEDRDENNLPIGVITGNFEITAKIQIDIKLTKRFIAVTVVGSATARLEAKAKWSARGKIDCNDKGFYSDFYGSFDGLEIVGELTIDGKVENGDGDSIFGLNEGTKIKYQAIDKKPEKELFILKFYSET